MQTEAEAVTFLEKKIRNDPIILNYIRHHCNLVRGLDNLILVDPRDAVAEKYIFAYGVLSGAMSLNTENNFLTQEDAGKFKQIVWRDLYRAETLFIETKQWFLIKELALKIKDSLNNIAKENWPKAKKLPFDPVYISYASGIRTKQLIDIDSLLWRRAPDSGGILQFAFSEKKYYFNGFAEQFETDAIALFLEEKVCSVEKIDLSRQERREAIRKGYCTDRDSVRVLKFRELDNSQDGGTNINVDNSGEYQYANRWLVRGHLRNQFFPKENCHKLIWIDPFVKGPEGKPFLEKVRHVNR